MNSYSKNLKKQSSVRSVGRPKSITPQVVQELVQCFKDGLDIKSACILSGISTSSYYKELATDKHFTDKMTIAQNNTTIIANSVIIDAIVNKRDVNIARWWIDRQDRLASKARNAKSYRLIRKIVLTKNYQETECVEIEIDNNTN